MQCPKCHFNDTRVIDSRPTEDNTAIRRRRECAHCGIRFTTFERVEKTPLLVIKRDNTREEFSREKLLRGLVRACEKRPVSLETLQNLVADIEDTIRASGESEVKSSTIGELVMDALPKIDEVSYIRYASVYRDFKDTSVFLQEINHLKERKRNEVEGQTVLDLDGTGEERDVLDREKRSRQKK